MINNHSPPRHPSPPKTKTGLTVKELELVFSRFPELRESMKGHYEDIHIVLHTDILVIQVGDQIKSDHTLIYPTPFIKKNWKTVSKEVAHTDDGTEMTIEHQEIDEHDST